MQAWEQFLLYLEENLGKKTVNKWLRTLNVVHFDACNLYLEAKDSIHILWFEEHVRAQAILRLCNNNHHPIKVHLTTPSDDQPKIKTRGKRLAPPQDKTTKNEPRLSISSDPIDPLTTFNAFITSEENLYPLQFLSTFKLGAFNPLYLFGEKSSGKTHLLMALSHKLQDQGLNVHFAHTQTFTEHFIAAIRLSKMEPFRRAYREVDVLILDDVHMLAQRGATQEELFHTFNALHSLGKQIILASYLPPAKLKDIEPRLISRFEWGIVLGIKPLPKSQRKELLKQRGAERSFPLSDEVIDFLLESFSTTATLLIACDALALRAEDKNIGIVEVESAQVLLNDLIVKQKEKKISPDSIISCVAYYYDLQKRDLLGKAQTKECSLPRQVAMFFCRHELKMPFKQIGKLFSRDHSTVMSGIKQIQNKLENREKEMCTSVKEVHTILKEE